MHGLEAMSTMEFCPSSEMDQVPSNLLEMIDSDVQSQLLDLENLNSDKFGDFMFDVTPHDTNPAQTNMDFDQENNDLSNLSWFQNIQYDISKVPQSLLDASCEVENNNPNLLVNPQTGLPVQLNQQRNGQVNHVTVKNGLLTGNVKVQTQPTVISQSQQPQVQYVTVQNVVGTDANLNNTHVGYTIQPVTLCSPQVQNVRHVYVTGTPSQNSPVLVEHLQNNKLQQQNRLNQAKVDKFEKIYPKPVYSYSCLIAMALKNSKTGELPVSDIYAFMIENFPYFKTAPDGWKNSVRHNLSLNKCFAKVETPKMTGSHTRKGCLWALNPAKVEKMEEEIVKWRKKDPESVKNSMANPENLELIEQGKAGPPKSTCEEQSTPVKQEQFTPANQEQVTLSPFKQGHVTVPPRTPVKQLLGTHVKQEPQHQVIGISNEGAVMVKAEPTNVTITDIKDLKVLDSNLNLDPALSELALQSGLWDEDFSSELSLEIPVTLQSVPMSSLQSLPSTPPHGSIYQGNIMYSTSPLVSQSPLANTTPTKLYPQTPTRIVTAQT